MPSSDSSQSSFDEAADQIKNILQEAPRNYQATKKLICITHFSLLSLCLTLVLCKQALARDGYWCVVTKIYDRHAIEGNNKLLETINRKRVS